MAAAVKVGSFGGTVRKPFDTGPARAVHNFKIGYDSAIVAVAINVPPEEATVELKEGEFLTGITVHVGPLGGSTVVRSLSLDSNLATYGPYGPKTETSFSIPVVNGTIVGFFGYSESYVDAIGVYIAPNK